MNVIGGRSKSDQELEKAAGFSFDLRGASFSRANLFRKNFRGAMLQEAALSGANLVQTDLSKASLVRATLSSPWVILKMANPMDENPVTEVTDMTDVILNGASLWGAQMIGVNLWGGNLKDAHLEEADLSDAVLWNSKLPWAHLEGANMSRGSLVNANLADAILTNTNLSGTDFRGSEPNGVSTPPARGLTQGELLRAFADPNNPPKLDGVLDAETGADLGEVKWDWHLPA